MFFGHSEVTEINSLHINFKKHLVIILQQINYFKYLRISYFRKTMKCILSIVGLSTIESSNEFERQ